MANASEQINNLVMLTSHKNEEYKNYLIAKYSASFLKILKTARNLIRTEYDAEHTTEKDKKIFKKTLTEEMNEQLEELKTKLYKELEEFTNTSATLYTDQLDSVFKPVSEFIDITKTDDEKLSKKFNSDYLNFEKSSHTIESMWTVFTANLYGKVESTVDQAYTLDMEAEEFEETLVGLTGNTAPSKNYLKTLIAALVTFGYNTAIKYTNANNKNVFSGYVWQSVIDSSTTEICSYLNNRYWLYGNKAESTLPYEITAPAHYGCRSATYPIVKSYADLRLGSKGLTTSQEELLSGEIPEVPSYSNFIASQPKNVQKEILGAVRYDLYSSGQLSVADMYTSDGRKLTLAELQKKGYTISSQYMQYIRKTT